MADKKVEMEVGLKTEPMNKKLHEAKEEFKKLKDDLVKGFTDLAAGGIGAGIAGVGISAGIGLGRAAWSAGAGAGVREADRYFFEDVDASRVAKERVTQEFQQMFAGMPKDAMDKNRAALEKLSQIMIKIHEQQELSSRAAGNIAYPVEDRIADAIKEGMRAAGREKVLEALGTTGK